ncbi:hypothetical protein PPYR_05777 [Photinus pyralis]|uniref:Transmembrane protein 199 n=1 Tax=Photinus pyralis TaxID=7054 RepID=A0A1Y1JXB7_PHOPY|nr:uncharacterized protein LOC116165299 [Photinus pyralis]KAB0801423.1 hypothetical protein PPYR_05777 [Photinus pyralis]
MKAALNNSSITILPSEKLIKRIRSLHQYDDAPPNICAMRATKPKSTSDPLSIPDTVLTETDRTFIESLKLEPVVIDTYDEECNNMKSTLLLSDLIWLSNKLHMENCYLHDLLLGSEVILPKNDEIPRNEELDARCSRLKIQQENREYKAITKNVDNVTKPLPEDTIAYQIKQINKQLIAVFQFIVSVLTGFLFGFHGIELLVGTLDFGFRLLLGVICSLTIALAELYFLAKTLNEDYRQEVQVENRSGHSKLH